MTRFTAGSAVVDFAPEAADLPGLLPTDFVLVFLTEAFFIEVLFFEAVVAGFLLSVAAFLRLAVFTATAFFLLACFLATTCFALADCLAFGRELPLPAAAFFLLVVFAVTFFPAAAFFTEDFFLLPAPAVFLPLLTALLAGADFLALLVDADFLLEAFLRTAMGVSLLRICRCLQNGGLYRVRGR